MKRTLALALLAVGCGPPLLPETLVTDLRVLSIVNDPPEVAPGQSSSISILELDPSRPGGVTTVLWVGCEPDPLGLGRGACSDTSALLQPTAFADFPPGVRILGFGQTAGYASSPNLFDGVDPTNPVIQNGTVGPVLAVVIGDEIDPSSDSAALRALFTKIENQEIKTVLSLTRITVSEHTPQNKNPHLDAVTIDSAPLPKGARVLVEPGQKISLHVTGGDRETYTLVVPDGTETDTENLVGAWYSSSGRFDQERFDLDTGADTVFTAPGSPDIPEDPVPDKRNGVLWIVLRDDRGGQAYQTLPFYVCDDTLAAPQVSAVQSPATPQDQVKLTGTNLGSILDVVVDGVALAHGGSGGDGTLFAADPPALPAGPHAVSIRTRTCASIDTGLDVTLP